MSEKVRLSCAMSLAITFNIWTVEHVSAALEHTLPDNDWLYFSSDTAKKA